MRSRLESSNKSASSQGLRRHCRPPRPLSAPTSSAHALDRDVPLGFLHHYQVTNDLARGWDIKMECVFQSRGGKGSCERQSRLRKFGRESGNAATQAHTPGVFIREQVHIFVVSHFSFTGIFNVTLFFFCFFFICILVCQTSSWVTVVLWSSVIPHHDESPARKMTSYEWKKNLRVNHFL